MERKWNKTEQHGLFGFRLFANRFFSPDEVDETASLVYSQTRYLPNEPDICWTYQIFPIIWSLLGGRYLVGAAFTRLSGAGGARYLALVPISHQIAPQNRHQISG